MIKAKVRWFDGLSGQGVIRLTDSQTSHPIHFTAIKGIEKNNHHWPTTQDQQILKCIDNMECLVELSEGQVSKCIILGQEFPNLILKYGV